MWAITPGRSKVWKSGCPTIQWMERWEGTKKHTEVEEPVKEEEHLEHSTSVSQSKSLFLEKVVNCAEYCSFAEQMEERIIFHILEYGGQV